MKICYHARHASFTGGVVAFFLVVLARRAGEESPEKTGTFSIAIVSRSPGGQKRNMRRTEAAYILKARRS